MDGWMCDCWSSAHRWQASVGAIYFFFLGGGGGGGGWTGDVLISTFNSIITMQLYRTFTWLVEIWQTISLEHFVTEKLRASSKLQVWETSGKLHVVASLWQCTSVVTISLLTTWNNKLATSLCTHCLWHDSGKLVRGYGKFGVFKLVITLLQACGKLEANLWQASASL